MKVKNAIIILVIGLLIILVFFGYMYLETKKINSNPNTVNTNIQKNNGTTTGVKENKEIDSNELVEVEVKSAREEQIKAADKMMTEMVTETEKTPEEREEMIKSADQMMLDMIERNKK